MVAGLMLETILEEPDLPPDPRSRRRLIKSRLADSLVTHLAGRITLDRFRTLVARLEQWFPFYYPLMPSPAPPDTPRPGPGDEGRFPPAPLASSPTIVCHDRLQDWLEKAGAGILPWRPQRKLKPEGLLDFLVRSQGRWFRVKDLAGDFDIDRKTAWEYLQKLQGTGLVTHNGGRSAAVRFRLADRFLRVRLSALEGKVTLALAPALSPTSTKQFSGPRAALIAQWLAATNGAPFWEEGWPPRLAPREKVIAALESAAVLEVVFRSEGQRLLRLKRQWLEEQ